MSQVSIEEDEMNTLPTRALGTSGIEITTIGFGSLPMGGSQWVSGRGAQDADASIRTFRRALERGINWIDTAPIYGNGLAEELIGTELASMPESERPLVFTKAGLLWDDDAPRAEPFRTGDPRAIRADVEASLRRLRVERLDVLHMHWPPQDDFTVEDYWPVFLELRDRGMVRAIGLSNHDADQLRRAEQLGHVDVIQPPLSALNRDAAAQLIPLAKASGTGVICYAPLESGLLSGGFSPERVTQLPDDDWRRTHPDFTGERFLANLAVVDELKRIGAEHDVPASAVAIAWVLSVPGVTSAIAGARSPEQIDDWVDTAELTLSERELASIATVIEEHDAGTGPANPRLAS
ncbi:aldo/keto reductase [Microbacterium alcoholitolerans]|uniref:aldo/keto reductase n=1 Tax=unclassified Microbacterium TaxID=2609290 RepID=UPI003D17165B